MKQSRYEQLLEEFRRDCPPGTTREDADKLFCRSLQGQAGRLYDAISECGAAFAAAVPGLRKLEKILRLEGRTRK